MPNRKLRTREHIIADLSENHFERYALGQGFSTESTVNDYGYDIILSTYDINGEIENGIIWVQLKATDSITFIDQGKCVSFTVDKRDLDLWLNEFYPVILVVYDAKALKGYWIYIQSYFKNLNGFHLTNVRKTINVHIPVNNQIGASAMRKFCVFKEKMYAQIINVIHQE